MNSKQQRLADKQAAKLQAKEKAKAEKKAAKEKAKIDKEIQEAPILMFQKAELEYQRKEHRNE